MMLPKLTIVLLFIVPTAAAAKDGWFLSENYHLTPFKVKVSFGPTCNIILTDTLKKELMAEAELVKTGKEPCRSMTSWDWFQCSNRHIQLISSIRDLTGFHRHHKRDLFDTIGHYAKVFSEVVIEGATLFIRGITGYSTSDMASSLLDTLLHQVQGDYNNKQLVPNDVAEKSISDVSIYASQRKQFLRRAIEQQPYEERFYDYMNNELTASETLIESIADRLKKGQMDTQALGELVSNDDLMNINPDKTRKAHAREISDSFGPNITGIEIEFSFESVDEFGIFERVKWANVGNFTLIILFLAVLTFIGVKSQKFATTLQGLNIRSRSAAVIQSTHQNLNDLDRECVEAFVTQPRDAQIDHGFQKSSSVTSFRGSVRSHNVNQVTPC